MSTVPPKTGRDSAMVRYELLAEPHDIGRAGLRRGLLSKAGGRCEICGNTQQESSTDR